MRRFIILFLMSSVVLSCKKDKLKGDKSIFIGKWKWVNTDIITNTCNPPEGYYFLTPSSENKNFSIEFLEKGKVIYYEDGEKTNKDRIVFNEFEYIDYLPWIEYYKFSIYGDNKGDADHLLSGYVKQDTLVISNPGGRWPHFYTCSCCSVKSYFIRE